METGFRLRSYGYYGATYLELARGCVQRSEYEQAALHYQHSIECSCKQVLAYGHCVDKALMQSHKVLRLSLVVLKDVSDQERHALRVLGLAYFQLRYPVDDEIDEELLSLGSPGNAILSVADSVAARALGAAHEAQKVLSTGLNKIKKLNLD